MEDKELGYSTRVSRPNLYENEIRYSTSERALGFLKNYYLYLSKDQSHFRRQFDEEIVFQLDNYKTIRSNDITKHKLEIDKIHDEIKYHEDYLNKLKKQLLKLLEDVYHGKEKLIILNRAVEEFLLTKVANESAKKDYNTSKDKVIGRILSAFDNNPITDKEKLLKKLEKLDHEVMNKMAEIASKKKVLLDCILRRDEVYKKALKSFEMAEKGRLMHTKNVLKKFVELEKNALENRLKLLHAFEVSHDLLSSPQYIL